MTTALRPSPGYTRCAHQATLRGILAHTGDYPFCIFMFVKGLRPLTRQARNAHFTAFRRLQAWTGHPRF